MTEYPSSNLPIECLAEENPYNEVKGIVPSDDDDDAATANDRDDFHQYSPEKKTSEFFGFDDDPLLTDLINGLASTEKMISKRKMERLEQKNRELQKKLSEMLDQQNTVKAKPTTQPNGNVPVEKNSHETQDENFSSNADLSLSHARVYDSPSQINENRAATKNTTTDEYDNLCFDAGQSIYEEPSNTEKGNATSEANETYSMPHINLQGNSSGFDSEDYFF